MNILNDSKYGSKYCFHIGDLVGNILYTFKKNDINENTVSNELIRKYIFILAEEFTKANIKVEFTISDKETEEFIKKSKGIFGPSKDNNGISLTKNLSKNDIARISYLAMPMKILNIVRNEEIEAKIIEAYNDEKDQKVLKK